MTTSKGGLAPCHQKRQGELYYSLVQIIATVNIALGLGLCLGYVVLR